MLLINDDEFFEGFLGGLGWLVAVFYVRNAYYRRDGKFIGNPFFIGIIGWAIAWYIRKIGMNLYKQYKYLNKDKLWRLKLPFKKLTKYNIYLVTVFFFCIVLLLMVFRPTSTGLFVKWSNGDIPLILFMVLSTMAVYQYGTKIKITDK